MNTYDQWGLSFTVLAVWGLYAPGPGLSTAVDLFFPTFVILFLLQGAVPIDHAWLLAITDFVNNRLNM
jgi:hypothetical protein